jgi:3-hydroxyisobutyrate dehydrogenase
VVEAAVTGGAAMAAEGRSTFLLGGAAEDLVALEPILAACGDVRIHAGPLGQASRLKLCINLQTYATFMGVSEAATLAQHFDLPLDALRTAMAANGQLGDMTRSYMTLFDFTEEALADPATRRFLEGYANIIEKDLDLITRLAAEAGVPVPTAELAGRVARRVYRLEVPTP